jgi:lipopolysaccharide biosynthesis glycosyltransferase
MQSNLYAKSEEQQIESKENIVLVCAADDKYAMPLAVAVRSVLENLTDDNSLSLFIIDGGIKIHNKQKILKSLCSTKCKIEFISKPDSWLKRVEETYIQCEIMGITKNNYVSLSSYFRLFTAELLPQEIKKAIYLDCDLVVLGNLEELWQIDLEEYYLLAAQDDHISCISSPNGLLNYQVLGIHPDSKYFNAGVLVINLEKWRIDKIATKAIQYLTQNFEYVRYHDQDVLNALFACQWKELESKWNYMPNISNSLTVDPCIIHFASAGKPWNSRHIKLKDYFFKYVDMTEWSGWRLTLLRLMWLKIIKIFHVNI